MCTTRGDAIPSGVNYFGKCPPKGEGEEGRRGVGGGGGHPALLSYSIASSSANHEAALVGLCVATGLEYKQVYECRKNNNDSAKAASESSTAATRLHGCITHVIRV